jgi:hypothetical protein
MPGKQIPSSLECLHQPSKLIAVCFILRELDIYPLNFIMSFPPSVQCSRGQTSPHTGQGPSWVLSSQPIYCNLCSSSTNEITTDEQLKITPIMQASCNNFPYKIYTSTGASNHSNWLGTQLARWYICTVPGCHVQYQVRRRNFYLAVYTKGIHHHVDVCPRQYGLSHLTKKHLMDLRASKNFAEIFVKNLRDDAYPEDDISVLTNGINMDNAEQVKKFKKKCTQFMWRNKKLQRTVKVPKLCVGTNQAAFKSWLDSKFVKVGWLKDPSTVTGPAKSEIMVLQHSIGHVADSTTGQFIITTYEHISSIVASIQKSKQLGMQAYGVLVEIDYTSGLLQDYSIGCVGASDSDRRFFPFVFDVDINENGDGAFALLSITIDIIKHYNGICYRVLKDGGSALSSAALLLGLEELNCLTHMIRCGWCKKGHGSGECSMCAIIQRFC